MTSEPEFVSLDELLGHAPWAERVAARLVGDRAEADDVVQEAWLVSLERPPRRSGSPQAWLARVLRNLAWQRNREERRRS